MLNFLIKLQERLIKILRIKNVRFVDREDLNKVIHDTELDTGLINKETYFPSFEETNKPDIKLDEDTLKKQLAHISAGNQLEDSIEKEVKENIRKVKISELTIYFKDNNVLSWSHETEIDCNIFPWQEFYKWYLTKNTPLYCFIDNKQETIFRREDIIRVIRLKTYQVEKNDRA